MKLGIALAACLVLGLEASSIGTDARNDTSEVGRFNQRFAELISRSDHAGMLAMWAEDGADLMPGEAPLVGKEAIDAWLKRIEAASPGSHVVREEVEFHDIQVSGEWASEWATEHQMVQPSGKPLVEGWGKIILVLHRDVRGEWKIKQEMWNDAPKPDSQRIVISAVVDSGHD